jgi:hypothetical protein
MVRYVFLFPADAWNSALELAGRPQRGNLVLNLVIMPCVVVSYPPSFPLIILSNISMLCKNYLNCDSIIQRFHLQHETASSNGQAVLSIALK